MVVVVRQYVSEGQLDHEQTETQMREIGADELQGNVSG